ncbi:uncharacterized protein BXZ73DRAFT_51209 [Epithele typhae]|uniref:uncharacterized protein n=1 Tax=Epithele typhae TaxID=378194 RepID=UPI002007E392|nr:uncharacterized protein BXZ73DRAFT_51209 [Epithele typhae]KAH9922839.1 hypothetical protein BXZ73DRAFT_51209 [Epithele typhae]
MSHDVDMDADEPQHPWLDSVEGEISFFRALTRARPVGIHRHFHVLTMSNAIRRDTGQSVSVEELWAKLHACYDLDILENIEADGFDVPGDGVSAGTPPLPLRSPSPSENLSRHPFFRAEFALPSDDAIDALIVSRRTRATASLPSSSPAPSPVAHAKAGRGGRKGKSKLKVTAGLVGGESDSSALTQESGDESVMPTPRESNATGTDGGEDFEEEEDARQSPAASIAAKQSTRGRGKGTRGRGGRGRGGGAGTRGKKKKK